MQSEKRWRTWREGVESRKRRTGSVGILCAVEFGRRSGFHDGSAQMVKYIIIGHCFFLNRLTLIRKIYQKKMSVQEISF